MVSQGTFVQLASKGPFEDSFGLEPTVRPFKQCYKRPSRFALEEKIQLFPNECHFGSTNNFVDISRDGDLLGSITLQITLPVVEDAAPGTTWVNSIGYVLLRRVILQIDDTVVQDQERLWYDISDHLFGKAEHMPGLDAMIGRNVTLPVTQKHTLYVPLKLLCCKDHRSEQNWMPLINISKSTIRLTLHTETLEKCLSTAYPGTYAEPLDIQALVQYATVEAPDREQLLLRPTAILYESVQDMESQSFKPVTSITGSDTRMPLETIKIDMAELNSPVKLLAWVSYQTLYDTYFDYTDDIAQSLFLINGNERFSPQSEGYFQLLEKFYRTDAARPNNIHTYSFALNAAMWQPSGALNFDQVPSPILQVTLKTLRTDMTIKAFAVCYKRLIFSGGRAVLEYI